ncbi:MAG: hypothetical protein ACJ0A3_04540 [Dehalococcoidia bacterium]
MSKNGVMKQQEEFLKAYASKGTIRRLLWQGGVERVTVNVWKKDQVSHDKFELAKDDFREQLEEIAFQRLKEQTSKDNPVLLLALRKSN